VSSLPPSALSPLPAIPPASPTVGAVSVKLRLYAALVGGLLFLALATGRPELVAVAAPFAVVVVLGLALVDPPALRARVQLSRERVLEGEPVEVEIHVESSAPIARLELAVRLSDHLEPIDGQRVRVLTLPRGADAAPTVVRLAVAASRWGGHRVGPIAYRASDAAGLCVFEGVGDQDHPLRVYPQRETLAALVAPADTQALAGNRPARVRGDGIEFADLRPFVPGDRVREVNWRVAARRGGLWVNERHPERNSDVVVLFDTFAEALVDRAVRAAAALVAAYAAERDRIGLVDFGGSLRWVEPGAGLGHLYRITEALIDTQFFVSYAWRRIGTVPARTIPPKALVLALSPLEDERAVAALADLRGRGIDVAVIEISPDRAPDQSRHHTPDDAPEISPDDSVRPRADQLDRLGDRIWWLQRELRRAQFRRLGVPVVEWPEGRPLAAVLEEASAFRRRARRRAG